MGEQSDNLNPCPFCGGNDLFCDYGYIWYAVVRCRTCNATGPRIKIEPRGTRRRLEEAWNGRYRKC